jgi:hypothetical protein
MTAALRTAVILCAVAPAAAFAGDGDRFSFAVWGDQPYNDAEYLFTTQRTIPDLNADGT